MKVNKGLILFVFLILIVPAVLAQQPAPFQESELPTQLEIAVPKVEYIPESSVFDFHIHTFNSSGHIQSNSTTDCYIHIYNLTGNHILEEEMLFDSNNMDFYYELNTSFSSELGYLPYIVQCNNTDEGGYASGDIPINNRTKINGLWSDNMLAIILSILGVVVYFGLIGYAALRVSGMYLDKKLFWMALLCFSYTFIELIYMVGLVWLNETGGSDVLVNLMQINFYITALIGFGVGMIVTIMVIMNIMRPEGYSDKGWKGKW